MPNGTSSSILFLTAITLLGLFVGSFLNVIIYRLPIYIEQPNREASKTFWQRRSFCPNCNLQLPFWAILPILSYLVLRGSSHCCLTKIPINYLLVEISSALFSLFLALHFGANSELLFALVLLWSLLILTLIDFQTFLLPDQITLPILWLGLFSNIFGSFTYLQNAVIGAIVGYLFCFLLEKLIVKIKNIEGLGRGDAKCLAMLGAWFGWKALPLIMFIASVTGAIYGVCYLLHSRNTTRTLLPFGPFLALSGIICLFWGDKLI